MEKIKLKNQVKRNNGGITLIVLVITIIVLLILAGISIMMLAGDNSILKKAGEAKEITGRAEIEETITMAYNAVIVDKYTGGTENFANSLKSELEKTFGTGKVTVTETDGTYEITIDGKGIYIIDENGNIKQPIDAKYIPTVSYIVGATQDAETDINGAGTINAGETAYVIVTISIGEGTISQVTPGEGLTLVSSDAGKYVYSVTADGNYTITIVSNAGTQNEYRKDETINISGAYKIANMPDSWQVANSSNSENDWYAYKDNNGNIAKVNAPKLANGMTAIKYVAGSDAATYGTLTAGSKWANAMTKDGSMWVWIPRFAYKITSGYHQSGDNINSTDGTLGAGTIDIAFLDTKNNFLNGETGDVKTNIADVKYTGNAQNEWLLAPGFTFGDEPISGFWFAKFEASNTAGYGSSSSTANNPSLTLQIKPNARSWTYITSANMFTVCQNLTSATNYTTYFNNVNNVDTHMTKNVEWGAVAYLAHSKYGLNGQEICINNNSSYITGIGGGSTSASTSSSTTNQYNTTTGITASTTKNVYGIYDMSGGAWEYVAACLTGYTSKLTTNTDTSYINKYIDVYNAYSTGYTSSKYGDAIYETSNTTAYNNSPYSWFKDFSYFVDSGYPVFGRGGGYGDGSVAGLFSFSGNNGSAVNVTGFRPVCVVK